MVRHGLKKCNRFMEKPIYFITLEPHESLPRYRAGKLTTQVARRDDQQRIARDGHEQARINPTPHRNRHGKHTRKNPRRAIHTPHPRQAIVGVLTEQAKPSQSTSTTKAAYQQQASPQSPSTSPQSTAKTQHSAADTSPSTPAHSENPTHQTSTSQTTRPYPTWSSHQSTTTATSASTSTAKHTYSPTSPATSHQVHLSRH